ncbi:MAG: methylenetetrahydrofolate reductase [NAD(P)H] [Wenzhouxiangellaceae bacterium]|nr:methylenetetrahydrofolate reductase [NAD(P)H] [Wenzhouxiangellaceae bacterium]
MPHSINDPQLSFEFFPPKNDEQVEVFKRTRDRLAALKPEYMSVTFGAGGSTRARTRETVFNIQRETGVPAAPHISCMSEDIDSIDELLDSYREFGINRLVVLRGDRPSGGGSGVFDYAVDLVRHIREHYGNRFTIEVGCYPEYHPEAKTPEADLEHFRRKVEAGADSAITQYFFSADAYEQFLEDCARLGVRVPIVPGIMPITNYSRLGRFSKMCGADMPMWIFKRVRAWEEAEDFKSIRKFGEEVITDLCRRLLDFGAPGIHFYTLNRAQATLKLCRNLGLGEGNERPGDTRAA